MTPRRGPGAAAQVVLLAALASAPLLPGLLSFRTLYFRDVGQNHLPNRALTMEMAREGLPLWNPHRGCGQPFLANPNSLLLRPTTILFLPFPPALVHVPLTLSVMFLLTAAALGTWALLRDLGLSAAASIAGASAFALSGAVQSLGQLLNHLEGVAFVPATLWALQRALARGWRPWAPLAGIAFGLVASAGEPIWIGVTALAAAALPGVRAAGGRRAGGVLAAAAGFGLLVAAPQVLPLAENAARSERGAGLEKEEVLKWSLPPQALVETIVSGLWGDPTRSSPDASWGAGLFESSLPWLLSIHLGGPVLMLAAFGALGRRDGQEPPEPARARVALTVCAAAGILFALGRHTPIYPLLTSLIPGAGSVRYPVKWYVLTTWCVAILAAVGFDRLASRAAAGRARSRPERAVLLLAACGLVAGAAAAAGGATGLVPALRTFLAIPPLWSDRLLAENAAPAIGRSVAVSCATALFVLVLLPRGADGSRARRRLAAWACVAALLYGAWGLNPSAPPDVVFEPSPLLEMMPEATDGSARFFAFPRPKGFAFRSPGRSDALDAFLPLDSLAWGMRWDVRTLRNATAYARGLRGAYDRLGDARLDLLPGSAVARELGDGMPIEEAVRFLEAASVMYVLAYGGLDHPRLTRVGGLPGESNVPVDLYRLERPAPRASLVGLAAPVAGPEEALAAIRSGWIDPHVSAAIEGAEDTAAEAEAPGDAGAGAPGEASIERESSNEALVRVRATRPAWLVLTDTFEPSWRALVDGRKAEIRRANGMFRAVRVPAGEHEVAFRYRPASVAAGAAAGALGLVACAGLIALPAWRRGGSGPA